MKCAPATRHAPHEQSVLGDALAEGVQLFEQVQKLSLSATAMSEFKVEEKQMEVRSDRQLSRSPGTNTCRPVTGRARLA